MRRSLAFAIVVNALMHSPALAQHADTVASYGPYPETIADVILVLEPHGTFPLHLPIPTERVISGSVLRVDRGAVPSMIVNTPNTIVSALHAGMPVKLYLKSFRDRNAHDIIGVFPASDGGKP